VGDVQHSTLRTNGSFIGAALDSPGWIIHDAGNIPKTIERHAAGARDQAPHVIKGRPAGPPSVRNKIARIMKRSPSIVRSHRQGHCTAASLFPRLLVRGPLQPLPPPPVRPVVVRPAPARPRRRLPVAYMRPGGVTAPKARGADLFSHVGDRVYEVKLVTPSTITLQRGRGCKIRCNCCSLISTPKIPAVALLWAMNNDVLRALIAGSSA